MIRLFLIGIVLGCLGCASNEPTETGGPPPVLTGGPLSIGEQIAVTEIEASLRFDDLLEDSRCPVDVHCIWEGNARLSLTLLSGQHEEIPFLLDTSPNVPGGSSQTRFLYRDHTIFIAQLQPEPRSDVSRSPEDYRLTIGVEAATR